MSNVLKYWKSDVFEWSSHGLSYITHVITQLIMINEKRIFRLFKYHFDFFHFKLCEKLTRFALKYYLRSIKKKKKRQVKAS